MTFAFAPGRPIGERELREKLGEALGGWKFQGKRVLVVVPDDTRTLPMRPIFDTLASTLSSQARQLHVLVALGTHPPMSEEALLRHLGPGFRDFPGVRVLQHEWNNPQALAHVGTVPQEEVARISCGLLVEDVPVRINKAALENDLLVVVGPVFPHEVVGFSGGHKYFFPGISGPDLLHTSHWLGALITNPKVNGHRDTPVRELIERAAQMVPTPRVGVSLVMRGHDLVGLYVGEVREAWAAAVEQSSQVNIVWTDRLYSTVLSLAPPMYGELWTAGKCMYKLEPVVEDGGMLIVYGPHVREVSLTHGRWLLDIGYHTRDYFLGQWERFRHLPRAVLAHSTHVKGIGTFRQGVERPRIEVVLATSIPPQVCQQVNLAYRDPCSIRPDEWQGEEDVLVVPNAGETLWRLKGGYVPDIDRL